jgi:multidrug efflux system membrane fusion protein
MSTKQFFHPVKLASLCIFMLTTSVCAVSDDSKLVTIKQVRQQNMTPIVWLPGNVISRRNVRLSAELNGRLVWISDIGTKVKKGEAIAKIETKELEFQLAEAESQLRQQQANTIYLVKQQKRLKALTKNMSTARIELDGTSRDLVIAQETLKSLNIQIARTQLAIDKATVRAPFDGLVNFRMAQQGEYTRVGNPLIQFVDPISLDISIAAPLSIAPFLSRGEKMEVKWNNQLISLPVRTWSPAGDLSSRTFNVRLDASHLDLMSGNGVTVSLPKENANLSTMVPRDALVLRERETFVIIVDEQNKAHKIDVTVGKGIQQWVSVSGEIVAGDRVIIRGGERLKEGDDVHFEINTTIEVNSIAVN